MSIANVITWPMIEILHVMRYRTQILWYIFKKWKFEQLLLLLFFLVILKCFARHIRKISTKTCIFLFSFTGQLESTDLFNLELLPSSQDHYRQLLPRFGHSLSTDSQGTLWVFGGYSFTQGGPLNDIRAFDTKNVSWLPITVHFTVS